jgi:hypothetical protein
VLTDSHSADLITNYNPSKNAIAVANNIFYDRWLDYANMPRTLLTKYSSGDRSLFADTDNRAQMTDLTQKQGLGLLPEEVIILRGETFETISSLDTSTWSKPSHLAWIGSGKSYELHLDVDGNWGSLEDQHLLANVKSRRPCKFPNLTFGMVETDTWTECPQASNRRPIVIMAK